MTGDALTQLRSVVRDNFMVAALTLAEQEAAQGHRHNPAEGWCTNCGFLWPCETQRLIEAAEQYRNSLKPAMPCGHTPLYFNCADGMERIIVHAAVNNSFPNSENDVYIDYWCNCGWVRAVRGEIEVPLERPRS